MNYVIANWKCNPESVKEAKKILAGYKKGIKKSKKAQVVVCPPALYLDLAKETLKSLVATGGQNCFCQDCGSFTGETSASQLAQSGCGYVIVGHSERRKLMGETNEHVNGKVKAALAAGLTPIICVGETREERIEGKITDVVELQIKEGLKDLDLCTSKIIIAYEPVWAIGTGQACSPEEAAVISQFIRNIACDKLPVLYGGSVNAANGVSYLAEAGYNGLLVGGASLQPIEFSKLVDNIIAL